MNQSPDDQIDNVSPGYHSAPDVTVDPDHVVALLMQVLANGPLPKEIARAVIEVNFPLAGAAASAVFAEIFTTAATDPTATPFCLRLINSQVFLSLNDASVTREAGTRSTRSARRSVGPSAMPSFSVSPLGAAPLEALRPAQTDKEIVIDVLEKRIAKLEGPVPFNDAKTRVLNHQGFSGGEREFEDIVFDLVDNDKAYRFAQAANGEIGLVNA
ncbi:hypothetical protein Enr13x_08550 [Stieleria neptunia]|uniref:Uncharacterized protein n=1 Tax=Stieleria neptunia TaxID=2527979 RepID=A0A518HJI7_9BACT|nr:hypothetical protein [Stieleria neptunia]QDV41017.1 hypothetical protein Enr13x_08550 [Stieleria neptunia]